MAPPELEYEKPAIRIRATMPGLVLFVSSLLPGGRLEVIDLDTDVVAATMEVPGSNAFVTKDWVGRMFFNCILYGERIVKTPEKMNRLRAEMAIKPTR